MMLYILIFNFECFTFLFLNTFMYLRIHYIYIYNLTTTIYTIYITVFKVVQEQCSIFFFFQEKELYLHSFDGSKRIEKNLKPISINKRDCD